MQLRYGRSSIHGSVRNERRTEFGCRTELVERLSYETRLRYWIWSTVSFGTIALRSSANGSARDGCDTEFSRGTDSGGTFGKRLRDGSRLAVGMEWSRYGSIANGDQKSKQKILTTPEEIFFRNSYKTY